MEALVSKQISLVDNVDITGQVYVKTLLTGLPHRQNPIPL